MKTIGNKRVLIIYNPVAGRRLKKKFDLIVKKLKENNLDIEIIFTQFTGHAKIIARENFNKYDMIAIAGGDGTINEVLNGVYDETTHISIIPLGTANVLAQEINLKNDVKSIVNYIVHGSIKPLWLGKANGQYFALMLSVGLDAISVANVNKNFKRWFGKFAYILSYLSAVIQSKNITYKVCIEGQILYASNVIVSNGRLYGGKFICAPAANLQEKKLYAILAKRNGRWNALKYSFFMFTNQYPYSKSVITIPLSGLEIECEEKKVPVQIDGDQAGYLPVKISVSEKYINFLYP